MYSATFICHSECFIDCTVLKYESQRTFVSSFPKEIHFITTEDEKEESAIKCIKSEDVSGGDSDSNSEGILKLKKVYLQNTLAWKVVVMFTSRMGNRSSKDTLAHFFFFSST